MSPFTPIVTIFVTFLFTAVWVRDNVPLMQTATDILHRAQAKTVINRPKHNASTLRALNLMDKGVNVRDAHKLATGQEKTSAQSLSALNKKFKQHSLTRPDIVKLAHRAVKETLKMVEVVNSKGEVTTPSHTNRLAAAQMVMDRAEPVVKVNHNLNINAEISPVDLSKYMTNVDK